MISKLIEIQNKNSRNKIMFQWKYLKLKKHSVLAFFQLCFYTVYKLQKCNFFYTNLARIQKKKEEKLKIFIKDFFSFKYPFWKNLLPACVKSGSSVVQKSAV